MDANTQPHKWPHNKWLTGPEKDPQKVAAGKALAEKTKQACEEDAISRAEKAEEKAKSWESSGRRLQHNSGDQYIQHPCFTC